MKLIRLLFIAVEKSVFKILNINDKTNTESRASKNFIGFLGEKDFKEVNLLLSHGNSYEQ